MVVRLEERIARMKKNQERRLHRKNAKIVKEGGTPMQIDRPLKPDTTVSVTRTLLLSFVWKESDAVGAETLWSLRADGPHEYV